MCSTFKRCSAKRKKHQRKKAILGKNLIFNNCQKLIKKKRSKFEIQVESFNMFVLNISQNFKNNL